MEEKEIEDSGAWFVEKYNVDVSEKLTGEIIRLKHIYKKNFEDNKSPFDFSNVIYIKHLDTIFPNVCVTVKIFSTLPVSVASAIRSFSVH